MAKSVFQVDLRFFDKVMQNGQPLLSKVKSYTEASYAAYLRQHRKKIPSSRMGRLRQAHEVCIRLSNSEAWRDLTHRHQYFCLSKHTMTDFLDNEHLKEEADSGPAEPLGGSCLNLARF